MVLEDILAQAAIRQVMNRYNLSGDANNVEALAACFTEDGILETSGNRFIGREGILGGLTDRRRQRKASFVRHHLTTSEITLTGSSTASSRSYFVVITDVGVDRSGIYTDSFRKEEGVWKIANRTVVIDFCNTGTLMNARDTRPAAPPAPGSLP